MIHLSLMTQKKINICQYFKAKQHRTFEILNNYYFFFTHVTQTNRMLCNSLIIVNLECMSDLHIGFEA